jgi:hypothetical protein
MDTAWLLDEEERGWRRWHEVLGRVPSDRFEEGTLTPEGWSPKDAVYHVGFWLADCARVLERIREGTFDRAAEDALDVDRVNADGFEVSRAMAPRDVRAMCEGARAEARNAFGTMPEVTGEAWEWFEESGPLHYAKHVDDLEAWLG